MGTSSCSEILPNEIRCGLPAVWSGEAEAGGRLPRCVLPRTRIRTAVVRAPRTTRHDRRVRSEGSANARCSRRAHCCRVRRPRKMSPPSGLALGSLGDCPQKWSAHHEACLRGLVSSRVSGPPDPVAGRKPAGTQPRRAIRGRPGPGAPRYPCPESGPDRTPPDGSELTPHGASGGDPRGRHGHPPPAAPPRAHLTPLRDGPGILRHQLDRIAGALDGPRVMIVVGFKMGLVMEAAPEAVFVYNELYDQTNTCKSLLKALRRPPGSVLWLNGDVVFVDGLLEDLRGKLARRPGFLCGEHRVGRRRGGQVHPVPDGYVEEPVQAGAGTPARRWGSATSPRPTGRCSSTTSTVRRLGLLRERPRDCDRPRGPAGPRGRHLPLRLRRGRLRPRPGPRQPLSWTPPAPA